MIFGYSRVSTVEQAEEGKSSLREQERKCRAIAQLRQIDAYDFQSFTDAGVSGSIPLAERPEGARMLQAADRGDVIVATKMDRLFRSASDALSTAAELKKRGIDLILVDMGSEPVTGNGVGKLFFGMLALVAEFERERIAERMNEGRKAKKMCNGHIGGHAPYGYKVVGQGKDARLVLDPEEQDVIALMRQIRKNYGFTKPYRVAQVMEGMGIRNRAGQPFHRMQITRMLNRIKEVGIVT